MTGVITYRVPIIRLVGIWRFLTPMDIVQEGDYGRRRHESRIYDAQWELVETTAWWYYLSQRQYTDMRTTSFPSREFVRGVSGESSIAIEYMTIESRTKDVLLETYISRTSSQYPQLGDDQNDPHTDLVPSRNLEIPDSN